MTGQMSKAECIRLNDEGLPVQSESAGGADPRMGRIYSLMDRSISGRELAKQTVKRLRDQARKGKGKK